MYYNLSSGPTFLRVRSSCLEDRTHDIARRSSGVLARLGRDEFKLQVQWFDVELEWVSA